jgi:NAD-dependent deacetylase
LWEQHRIEDVATPEAFAKNPALVLGFYNKRFSQMQAVSPNAAHLAIAKLEEKYDVQVITQNVDNLHERAGSSKVLHLHGELGKCRSSRYENDIRSMPESGLKVGDLCERGFQLRPHIVWFGELVPAIDIALEMVKQADMMLIVGTSLQVYPAAGLAYAMTPGKPIVLADPGDIPQELASSVHHIKERAAVALPALVALWLNEDPR